MTKLARLLTTDHPLFVFNIAQLERATGKAGVDMRLVVDITEIVHRVMRWLALDPADTSARELYQALNARIDDEEFKKVLEDTGYVLAEIDGDVVSLCRLDIADNEQNRTSFEHRRIDHAQRYLRREIIRRYAEHDRTDNLIVYELAAQMGVSREREQSDHFTAMNQNQIKRRDDVADNTKKQRILTVGDIFTDAFITLGDDTAKIIKEGDTEWLAVPFGRKPPYERVDIVKSVGPSPNVAVAVSRLGHDAALMAWIGDDETGEEAIEYLATENVDTKSMITEEGKATSYWYVLCYKADRTMLVKSEKYRYEWRDPEVKPDWIYLSYLGEDSWPLHEGVLEYLERNPDIKFAFQPGTFQFKWGAEKLAGVYGRSEIVLMNREEAMDVTGLPYDSVKDLADGLHKLGPKIAVITDGPNGSYVSDGERVLTIPNYPDPVPPLERTGAGDAFSSTFVAAIAAGESVETALLWSPINSMSVVQQVGAQRGLLTHDAILKYVAEAPDYYKVSELQE